MTAPITLRYHSTQRDLAEAILAAGKTLSKRKTDWSYGLLALLTLFFAVVGGLCLGVLIWSSLLDQPGSVLPWMFGGAALTILTLLATFRRMAWTQAGMLLNSRFGQSEQTLTLSQDGVVLSNPLAQWRTDWAGVEAIIPTKSGLAIAIAGIIIPAPNAAFTQPSKQDVIDQITLWHRAART